MNGPHMIEAEHPTLGRLYAFVDPAVRFCDSRADPLKFAARLTPFSTDAAAKAALIAAGA
jgi:hypothetical protein